MPSSRTDFELLTSLEVILSFPWTPLLQQRPSPGTLMPVMHSPAGNPLLALSGTFHPVFLLSLWPNRSWAWGQVFFSWLQPRHPPEVSPWTLLVPSIATHSPPAAIRGGSNQPLSSSHTAPFSWGHMSKSFKISLYFIPEATKESGTTEAKHFQ